ncbi:MAG TPA: hypothetical protein VNB24_09865 [Acidimicrobiales bacterium]|nr:hypothetical protein [Acidimicrobiales bacterium]
MTAVAAIAAPASAARPSRSSLTLASYIAGAALVVASAAVLAAFVAIRAQADSWPPDEINFDEYLSAMLSATMFLAVCFAGWASWASRTGNERQALAGLSLAAGMGLAFANLAWYTGSHAGFGASEHAFGLLLVASIAIVTVAALTAVLFAVTALIRTLGRTALPDHELIRASARYWFIAGAAWFVSPVALYGLTSVK